MHRFAERVSLKIQLVWHFYIQLRTNNWIRSSFCIVRYSLYFLAHGIGTDYIPAYAVHKAGEITT